MRKMPRKYLTLSCAILCATVGLTLLQGSTVPAEDYDTKREAARYMEDAMAHIRDYRQDVGLIINPDDIHGTGLIGQPYTFITTTLGAVEAKRTTANSDMAALMVELLTEAGVESGDVVGAGFSGSFPAMNLATLSACAAMDVDIRYIPSVGASTFGANEPELTFPDMVYRLVEDGVFPQAPLALSMGGASDCGLDMDGALRQEIFDRISTYNIPVINEPDFSENLAQRQQFYGEIQCYIGVGGNITSSGRGENTLSWGVIPPDTVHQLDETSGLMERYNAEGMPIVHILNIKELVADYHLPYDPATLPQPGDSAIYHTVDYPMLLPCIGGVLAVVILILGRKKNGEE